MGFTDRLVKEIYTSMSSHFVITGPLTAKTVKKFFAGVVLLVIYVVLP